MGISCFCRNPRPLTCKNSCARTLNAVLDHGSEQAFKEEYKTRKYSPYSLLNQKFKENSNEQATPGQLCFTATMENTLHEPR